MLEITHLTIAVAQWDVRLDDPPHNRQRSLSLLQQAAKAGADLVVFPELCISGYCFDDADHARRLAEPPDGPTIKLWQKAANAHDIAVAGGLAVTRGDGIANGLACIAPGTDDVTWYDKVHLFDREQRFFQQGDALQLWSWRGVQFGLMLCYDGWFPEVPRSLTLAGADVILAPGCWHKRPALVGELGAGLLLHTAAAYSNSVFVACASRTGREGDAHFAGGSAIVGPHGLIAGPGPEDEDAVITASIDLRQARFKHRTRRVHPIKNRRPELYHDLIETKHRP